MLSSSIIKSADLVAVGFFVQILRLAHIPSLDVVYDGVLWKGQRGEKNTSDHSHYAHILHDKFAARPVRCRSSNTLWWPIVGLGWSGVWFTDNATHDTYADAKEDPTDETSGRRSVLVEGFSQEKQYCTTKIINQSINQSIDHWNNH